MLPYLYFKKIKLYFKKIKQKDLTATGLKTNIAPPSYNTELSPCSKVYFNMLESFCCS